VEKRHGAYGEFRIFVDGAEVVDAGALAMVGIVPPMREMVAIVRDRLAAAAFG
jgi:hypothetical protein